jgi:hypothetical protein
MRTPLRILGAVFVTVGILLLAPAAVLANQRLHLIRTSWGIFDVEAGGAMLSDSAAAAIFGAAGIVLIALGAVLVQRRPESDKC